jgi:hypothetical protein
MFILLVKPKPTVIIEAQPKVESPECPVDCVEPAGFLQFAESVGCAKEPAKIFFMLNYFGIYDII